MLIREYRESDLAALRAIHSAQGFDYAWPDLRNPLFLTKLVLTRDEEDLRAANAETHDGSPGEHVASDNSGGAEAGANSGEGKCEIVGAALLRLTAEAYLLLDPRASTPRQRWQWLLALHEAARRDAAQRGLEDVHAWLPPPIAAKFGKRLARLGWLRDDAWMPYCKKLG